VFITVPSELIKECKQQLQSASVRREDLYKQAKYLSAKLNSKLHQNNQVNVEPQYPYICQQLNMQANEMCKTVPKLKII
jgi:hypothetical protein